MLFAAVTQEKSFRRAAKRLNMSVPPLVLQIDELEARLRMKLLERTPRGVSPTAQGNALMPMIDQLVRQGGGRGGGDPPPADTSGVGLTIGESSMTRTSTALRQA